MLKNNVACSYCGKEFHKKPSHIKNRNYCCKECLINDRERIYSGDKNPFLKYNYDRGFLKKIDTEFKAWLLGWIASDGSIGKNSITITIDKKDEDVLNIIKYNFCENIPIKNKKNSKLLSYTINSKEIMEDVLKILNLEKYGKKCFDLSKVDIDNNLLKHFFRGVFEGDGCVRIKSGTPEASISSSSLNFLNFIQNSISIVSKINKNRNCYNLNYCGNNALDFLNILYSESKYRMNRKYEKYLEACVWTPILNGKGNSTKIDNIYVAKTHEKAIFPSKTRASDSGYDLTLIDIWKKNGNVVFYDTGIRVKPPYGYYFDLVARSSITKSGYILANGIGVIDRTYTGSIKVPLIKIDENMPDLELPNKIVQIIPRPIVHFNFTQVDTLEETERGEGGFGSTDLKDTGV